MKQRCPLRVMSVPMPSAPLSPAIGVTITGGNVQKYASKKKKVLNAEENELFELTQAADIVFDQEVFKIIADLLKMNVAPQAVFQTLKAMCAGQRIADTSVGDITTTASSEPRDEDSIVSNKSTKPPAPPPSAAGPRTARVNTKMATYGPQDASTPHSQVRSKAGVSCSEKGREGSGHKVPRQPSANRGQKPTKSSGSSSLTSN